jgi:hypothetical protein
MEKHTWQEWEKILQDGIRILDPGAAIPAAAAAVLTDSSETWAGLAIMVRVEHCSRACIAARIRCFDIGCHGAGKPRVLIPLGTHSQRTRIANKLMAHADFPRDLVARRRQGRLAT